MEKITYNSSDCKNILEKARKYFKEPSAYYAYLGIINNLERNKDLYENGAEGEFEEIYKKFYNYCSSFE